MEEIAYTDDQWISLQVDTPSQTGNGPSLNRTRPEIRQKWTNFRTNAMRMGIY